MRLLLLAALFVIGFTQPSYASPNEGGRVEFEVLRNGQPFGRHHVHVTEVGGALRAQTSVALRVAAGPVTLFRYDHDCTETWRDGVLTALQCETLKDGRRMRIEGATRGGQLRVSGPRGETTFGPQTLPTSWWVRPPIGVDHMLDTETGARLPLRITRMGEEAISVGGERVQAERVRIHGALTVDLWYDADDRWIGCAFAVRGQRIEYRLVSPRGLAPA